MRDSPANPRGPSAASAYVGILAATLFVAAVLAALAAVGAHEQVLALLEWVDERGTWAGILFMLLMAAVVVLLLPGIMFTTGAGFVFGIVEGSVYVVLGSTLGAAVAFLVARYFFGARAARFVRSRARLQIVSEELAERGWKIVLLTRLIPFFPSKLSNYAFGLTAFSLRGYLAGTLVGFVPFSVHNVYLGSLAAELSMASVRGAERSSSEWLLYGGGFVMTAIAVVYLSALARRALARAAKGDDPGGPAA